MIGGNNNQSIVRMFFRKSQRRSICKIEIQHFRKHESCIVGMSCPVDFTAFAHQEKSFLMLLQQFNRLGNIIRQFQGFVLHGIGHSAAFNADNNFFPAWLQSHDFLRIGYNFETAPFCHFIEIPLI